MDFVNPDESQDFDQMFQRCRDGDQAAWSALVDRFAGFVYAIARQHRLEPHACDDVAQNVFAALSKNIDTIALPSALPSWLSTTTKRECWRTLRRAAKDATDETSGSSPLSAEIPDTILSSIEQHQRLRDGLSRLGARCQELLRALFFETDRPDYAAIAQRLSIPVGSIGPTRQRCLAKLLELVEPVADNTRAPGGPDG